MPRKPSSQHSDMQYTFLKFLADKCRLSTRTLRNVISGQSITWATALRISRATGCPMGAFRIKEDRRGLKADPEDNLRPKKKLGQNQLTDELAQQTASDTSKGQTRARVELKRTNKDDLSGNQN